MNFNWRLRMTKAQKQEEITGESLHRRILEIREEAVASGKAKRMRIRCVGDGRYQILKIEEL